MIIKIVPSVLSSIASPIKATYHKHSYKTQSIFPKIPIKFENSYSPTVIHDEKQDILSQHNLILTQLPRKEKTKEIRNGLKNLGSTCYLNSILQFLYHIPLFRQSIYKLASKDKVTLAIQNIFASLQLLDKIPVDTSELTKAFGWNIKDLLVQQDAHEFMHTFLQSLHKEMQCVILALFRGKQQSFIRCINVTYTSESSVDIMDISVDVTQTNSLEKSLNKMLQRELLTSENKYNAEQYGKQEAYIGIEFTELPRVMCIHLRRFEINEGENMSKNVNKIKKEFSFPKTIDMNKFAIKADNYDLFAVVVHSGTANCGHYYTFICENDTWIKFNDSQVTEVFETDAIEANFGGDNKAYSAYLLFYIRRESYNDVFFEINNDIIPQSSLNVVQKILENEDKKNKLEFKISTEQSLIQSCSQSLLSYNNPSFSVYVDKLGTTKDFFIAVANKMNVNLEELRIFGMNLENTMSRELHPTIEKLYTMTSFLYFFATTVKGEILVPVVLYVPSFKDPLRFLWFESINMEQEISFLFKKVHDVYQGGELKCWISSSKDQADYIYNPLESFTENAYKSGTIVVLQYDQFIPRVDENERENNFSITDRKRFLFYTTLNHSYPETFSEFIDSQFNVESIKINTEIKNETLVVPKRITTRDLKELIAISILNESFDSRMDTMLLFLNDDKKPFDIKDDDKILKKIHDINYGGSIFAMLFKSSLFDSLNGSMRVLIRIIEKNKILMDYKSLIVPENIRACDLLNLSIERKWIDKNRYIKLCSEAENHHLCVLNTQTILSELPTNLTLFAGDFILRMAIDEYDITVYDGKAPFLFNIRTIEDCQSVKKRLEKYLNKTLDNHSFYVKKCDKFKRSIPLNPESIISDVFDIKTDTLYLKLKE